MPPWLVFMKLYKYISPKVLSKVFRWGKTIGLRWSYPMDYNDPYELFLALSSYNDFEVVAFFSEIVGSIPQLPTTCFSQRPDIIPMWAHYGERFKGFVVELDEAVLRRNIPEVSIGNVKYKKAAEEIDAVSVGHALTTGKFRHTYMITQYAMNTDLTPWSIPVVSSDSGLSWFSPSQLFQTLQAPGHPGSYAA